MTLRENVDLLIRQHINWYSSQDCESILEGMQLLSGTAFTKDDSLPAIDLGTFQKSLSKINEKGKRRRTDGVYYTPKDVTKYIVANACLNFLTKDTRQVYPTEECEQRIKAAQPSDVLTATVFDPTCGTAEFLLSALEIKLACAGGLSDEALLDIVRTIYGNDISQESVFLSKTRIYFTAISQLNDKSRSAQLAAILNQNFSCLDFVITEHAWPTYDIIIGNPPYIEYGKLATKPETGFGNTYADVLKNAIDTLSAAGVVGFVIPLSFVSTTRMAKIRNFTYERLSKLFVINFADRPDCLFDGVHQKLTIMIGRKGEGACDVYSSSYYHWYKYERNGILDNCKVFPVAPADSFIPKIGNRLEDSIFHKILETSGTTIAHLGKEGATTGKVYLNMRGCFWMKAFSFNPGSKEYKALPVPEDWQPYIVAVLNSSLFFLYWTIVSDGWHVTGKELSGFPVPTENVNLEQFKHLASQLEGRLESTKKFIGSVQTAYEYKHRECKHEIDNIDNALQPIYRLSNEELAFLKDYKLKYRMSNGKV